MAYLEHMMTRAYDTAEIYASHANREGYVFPEDILMGLRYQAPAQGHGLIASKTGSVPTKAPSGFSISECGCKFCADVHQCFHIWDRWEPTLATDVDAKRLVENATRDWERRDQKDASQPMP